MAEDREIAGIRCMAVLERLDDYVADELSADARTQIEDHLRGCEWCARFGGRYASLVTSLRARLLDEEPETDAARLLAERLLRGSDHSPG